MKRNTGFVLVGLYETKQFKVKSKGIAFGFKKTKYEMRAKLI